MGRTQRGVSRPPGPSGSAFALGRLLRRDLPEALERPAMTHPRLAHLRLGHEHVYLLHHPEPVRSLLLTHGRATRKGRMSERIRLLLGDGLLTSEGELHRRQRRLIQPALQPDALRAYTGIMLDAAVDLAERWRPGRTVDMAREMSALALTIVSRALFGSDLSEDDAAEVADCLDLMLRGYAGHLLPGAGLLLSIPTPRHRRILAAVDRLDALVTRLVDERADRPSGPDDAADRTDLLSALVRRMSRRQARDETMTLLLAGHETTANALTWTWGLLDRNPEAAAWWREELDAVDLDVLEAIAAPTDGRPALPHENLPRTRAVLAEAMRLYPPSWLLGRRPLREIELDGWAVPAGSLCVTSQWVMHRDPRVWREPDRFRPQRWLTSSGDFDETAPGQPRGSYLPFGLGARACVGRHFAWAEGVLVLAVLGRVWAPRLVDGHPVRPLPAITLRPRHGLPMTLCPAQG